MKRKIISFWQAVAICALLGMPVALGFAPITVSAGTSEPAASAECDPDTDEECVDVCGTAGEPGRCNEFISKYINPLIRVLTALVGVTAVLSIVIAGIQYSSSADDPGTVTKAKQRIFNVILGLVAYIFLVAFLNYLVPGGVF